ncbi:MAG: UDP-N-acetylmuramoyl-L-alanine--D-glutamate ligase [Anaerolineae bacterium]
MIQRADWRDVRAGIVGAAREGLALARYLCASGARVTLMDAKPAEALEGAMQEVADLDLRLALGGAPVDMGGLDVLFVSPGVPSQAKVVRQAREAGLPLSSEPRLLTQSITCPVVGITGSSGKTTTTTLVGRMCEAQGLEVWVGGNIGEPLTPRLLEGDPPELAVMELSSFQLELFDPAYQGADTAQQRSEASRIIDLGGWSPHVAAITNVTPNHLDRHVTMEAYTWAKERILAYQQNDDWAVLNQDDAVTREMAQHARGQVLRFSLEQEVDEGAFLRGGSLMLRSGRTEVALCRAEEVRLRGWHNVANVLTAACCASLVGVDPEVIGDVARTFAGVPHRLEPVREWHGALFVNDSIATSPERAMAAMRAYEEPLVLLAGGRDKHLPWDEWASLALDRARAVIAFGEAVPIITQALSEAVTAAGVSGDAVSVTEVSSLEEAVAEAARVVRPGDVVLLSPGGTSFDAFVDFEARGERFRELVSQL